MSSSSSSAASGGIGFWGLLQILLIGLRFTGHIGWPWWQVLLPTIAGAGIAAICVLILIAAVIMDMRR
jgi:hypothetical protein